MRSRKGLAIAAALALAGLSATELAAHADTHAAADAPSSTATTEVRGLPRGTVAFDAGTRISIVQDEGLGPYAKGSVVPQFSLGASIVPMQRGAASLGLRAGWDVGITSEAVRGDPTSLTVHRLSLGLEARYAANGWLHVFARVSPAAMHLRATIEDEGVDVPLASRSWTWGLDTTAGAALRVGTSGKPEAPVRFWLTAEGGYGFAGKSDMTFSPDSDANDPRKFGDTTMPPLRLAGTITRFSFAVTF